MNKKNKPNMLFVNRHVSTCKKILTASKIQVFFNLQYLNIELLSVFISWMSIEIYERNHRRVFIWSKECLFTNAKAFFQHFSNLQFSN